MLQPQNEAEGEDNVPQDEQPEEMVSGTAQHPQQYAQLEFAERDPVPAPPSEMHTEECVEVSKA